MHYILYYTIPAIFDHQLVGSVDIAMDYQAEGHGFMGSSPSWINTLGLYITRRKCCLYNGICKWSIDLLVFSDRDDKP